MADRPENTIFNFGAKKIILKGEFDGATGVLITVRARERGEKDWSKHAPLLSQKIEVPRREMHKLSIGVTIPRIHEGDKKVVFVGNANDARALVLETMEDLRERMGRIEGVRANDGLRVDYGLRLQNMAIFAGPNLNQLSAAISFLNAEQLGGIGRLRAGLTLQATDESIQYTLYDLATSPVNLSVFEVRETHEAIVSRLNIELVGVQ